MASDPRPARAVVFPGDPDAPVAAQEVDASPAGILRLVGGHPEVLALTEDSALWFREDGKRVRLDKNPRAGRFVDALRPGFARHDWVAGPAVVLGFDATGLPADVPEAVRPT